MSHTTANDLDAILRRIAEAEDAYHAKRLAMKRAQDDYYAAGEALEAIEREFHDAIQAQKAKIREGSET